LLCDLLSTGCSFTNDLGILGAAPFVVRKKIQKSAISKGTKAINELNAFLATAVIVEPTDNEQAMAADFELEAQRAGVPLDTGESQLCAVLIVRTLPFLLTGDKRAIQAIEQLLDVDTRLRLVCGKVTSLEQIFLRALSEANQSAYRTAVCSEPNVDKTLTICFSCKSEHATPEGVREGLRSYINDLRSQSGQVLAA
jgi:hypothetical protein